jgi:pimeloyl-ACP methyl ester carboxylesterase
VALRLPETRYARASGGVHVAYQVHGSGPVDLAIVAGPAQHVEAIWDWPGARRMLERLGSFARVVRFDRRGTGLSDPFASAPTLEQVGDDLEAVLDAAGVERAALLGLSEACRAAAVFAAARPDRTRTLAVFGASPRGAAVINAAVRARILDAIEHAWGGTALLPVFAPSLAGAPTFEEFWSRYTRAACSRGMARSLLELAMRTDVTDVLTAVRVPTLVLHRRDDRLVAVEHGRAFAAAIPDARWVELAGQDNVVYAGDVDAVVDEVERFVRESDERTGAATMLATVLVGEITNAEQRAGALGERRWREALEDLDDLVSREVSRFRGRRLDAAEDGPRAAFDGAGRAIACARVLLQRVRVLGLELRAGLHAGELDRDELTGGALTAAATIGRAAAPGEVLVSNTVHDLVVGSGFEFEDRGEHELEQLPGTWHLAAVMA